MYRSKRRRKNYPCSIKHHAMKTYEELQVQLYAFLTLALDRVVSFKSQLLYLQGMKLWWQMDRKLCGLQSLSGHCGEDKNALVLLRIKP
jgi:hypothetical protein